MNETTMPITLDDYRAAHARVKPYIRRTPLVDAHPWVPGGAAQVRFKAECHQVTGSFKARGAFNRVLNLSDEVRRQGLATASGGNFGAAVAYVGKTLGLPANVFVMNTSTPITRARIESHGARLTVHGDFWDQSWDAAGANVAEHGGALLHPYADRDVVIGQGTTALEIIDEWPEVETLVVSIGGGGLLAGIAQAAKLAEGQKTPDFAFPDVNGKKWGPKDFRGKYLIIDFWASWCGPCRQEIPHIKEVYKKYKDKGLEILSVSVDAKPADWKKAMAEERMAWPQVNAVESKPVMASYMFSGIPYLVVVDKEGKIVEKNVRGESLDKAMEKIFGK